MPVERVERWRPKTLLFLPKVSGNQCRTTSKRIKDQSGLNLRILFGWTAKPKKIPWHIQFINENVPEYQCGGTLVTPNKIVSAAHCFEEILLEQLRGDWKPENVVAKAGNIHRLGTGPNSQQRKCSQIIKHS